MHKLKIKLVSDMCVSSGENYGATIDNDICYDEYGFPFIPSKGIKGCLKGIAMELCDWGIITEDTLNNIFGKIGGNCGELIIYDAKLINYDKQLISDLKNLSLNNKLKKYLHSQNILDNYTYTRVQTSIENGTAKESSLRFTRVVKRGTEFVLEYMLPAKYESDFEKCYKGLKSIGLHKTRGFGKIEITQYNTKNTSDNKQNTKNIESKIKNIEDETNYELQYDILLESNMVFPKLNDYTSTETYIQGSSIMGFLANQYIKNCGTENFNELFIDNNLIYQNAYISFNDKRCLPIPNSICELDNPNSQYCDRIVDEQIDSPTKKIKNKYILDYPNKEINFVEVETETDIHNTINNKRQVYSFSSICQGQVFKGHIIGLGKYIKLLSPLISNNTVITLGKSKNSQYGKGKITWYTPKAIEINKESSCNKFVVLLNSPTLILNKDNLSFSADINDIKIEIKEIIKEKYKDCDLKIDKSFINYKTVGGYNNKWRLSKRQLTAFDAGTILIFNSNIDVNISIFKGINIGEKTVEGYGEISVYKYDDIPKTLKALNQDNSNENNNNNIKIGENTKNLIISILKRQIQNNIESYAIKESQNNDINNSTTVGKLILITKENNKLDDFISIVNKIKDTEKKNRIFNSLFGKANEKEIKDFLLGIIKEDEDINKAMEEIKLDNILDIDEIYQIYTKTYLVHSKYKIKQNKGGKSDNE